MRVGYDRIADSNSLSMPYKFMMNFSRLPDSREQFTPNIQRLTNGFNFAPTANLWERKSGRYGCDAILHIINFDKYICLA